MIPRACISIHQIHIYLMLGIFSPRCRIVFFLVCFQLCLRMNMIFQVSRTRVCFSNTFIVSHKFFKVLSQTMILLLSLGLGSRRLNEGLIFTSPLVPAYLVQQRLPAHEMKAAIQSQEMICYYPDSLNLAVSSPSSVPL